MRTILLGEDEPQIAGLVRDYLEHAGFAVLAAGDGAGGSVQAESEGVAGRGSTFRVVLPLRD